MRGDWERENVRVFNAGADAVFVGRGGGGGGGRKEGRSESDCSFADERTRAASVRESAKFVRGSKWNSCFLMRRGVTIAR